MKIIQPIIFNLAILFSLTVIGQNENTKEYSVAESAIIIDSLENELENTTINKNDDLLFELALLYRQIERDQSIKYAYKYLSINDSSSSADKINIIYGLLALIYNQKGDIDSSYYFLSLQSTLIDKVYKEKSKVIKEKYLNSSTTPVLSNEIFGFPKLQFLIIVGLLVLLIVGSIYFFITKRRFRKTEAKSNKELEIANTKLSEFNKKLDRAVNKNTKDEAAALEKSTHAIVELRKSLKKAEESNYLKNAFLGSMSHQIRTPLSGIMGFSDLLELELAVMGNEDLYEYAKNIHESGGKLMNLITNIIDISSIEANILDLNILSCDLNKIFKEVEKKYLLRAKEKGLVYKTKLDSDLPKIKADKDSLVKTINIIMDNAIKYTEKGFVTISTTHTVSNNAVSIEIKDKGSGIGKEALNNLLTSFEYKKHGSSLTYQGQGLGLIIANRLIDLMSGKLEITSELGVGTNVKITLPCTPKTNANDDSENKFQKEVSIISAPEYGIIKIFIVEDDRMNRLVLEKMLKKTGDITTATDGKDALKILKSSSNNGKYFDVMLFDINLPDPWDGIKLMHEVKKIIPTYKNVPFIAQTAYAMLGDKDSYLEAGFNDYISKPIIKTELLTMIQKQFELHKMGSKIDETPIE